MVKEIVKLVKGKVTSNSSSVQTLIFDTRTCRETMAREFISLLGFISTIPRGRDFLEPILTAKDVEPSLLQLGGCPQYDFLSRLILMNLDLNDPSWQFSRLLMESWLSNEKASVSLRLCANDVLRTLLQSRSLAEKCEHWAIAMLMEQVSHGGTRSRVRVRARARLRLRLMLRLRLRLRLRVRVRLRLRLDALGRGNSEDTHNIQP